MPDTLHIQANDTVTHESLPQNLKDSIATLLSGTDANTHPSSFTDYIPFILFLILIGFIFYQARKRYINTPIQESPEIDHCRYLVYSGKSIQLGNEEIHAILLKYFPYYIPLKDALKERFVERVQIFMRSKQFVIHANEGFKEMPVLVSAAAVQLTLGLQKYKLPYYESIHIHPEEYFADHSLRILAGHVQGQAITISWKHFLKGFAEYTDGSNVGLHEMAHALYFQHVEADLIKGPGFIKHFNEIMEQGEDVYELKNKTHVLFSDYAFTNLQEFWAESVEIFFERPSAMRHAYPVLFEHLTELLGQNPLNVYDPIL
ncbi:zinc-dependent peptidase [Chitinophagaceae bacterium LWZ2-11]